MLKRLSWETTSVLARHSARFASLIATNSPENSATLKRLWRDPTKPKQGVPAAGRCASCRMAKRQREQVDSLRAPESEGDLLR